MDPTSDHELSEFANALIHSRQNVSPRWLEEPGSSAQQLQDILWVLHQHRYGKKTDNATLSTRCGELCQLPLRVERLPPRGTKDSLLCVMASTRNARAGPFARRWLLTTARSLHSMNSLANFCRPRCTSRIRTAPASVDSTRTPMACCASTFQSTPASSRSAKTMSMMLSINSTTDLANAWATAHHTRSFTAWRCDHLNCWMLHFVVEYAKEKCFYTNRDGRCKLLN